VGGEVVGLGAECEFVPEDVSRASPGSVSFDVSEFAVLADGRRLVLHAGERGFSVTGPRAFCDSPLGDLTAESIESGVLATVLPDEDDGEQHPWEWLCDLLRAHGVVVAPDELKAVPYEVVLGERVQRLLRSR
jgi:hypothetical protein